jgi:hypothetical protein
MITLILEPVIWFDYKGDEICWNGNKFISLLCEGEFDSLEEMDKFWEDYWNAVIQSSETQRWKMA